MCGLAGELRFDGGRPDVDALARSCAVLAPRGPDDHGTWVGGPLALGHRRLAIIDLSPAGAQPMIDAQLGLAVIFNGCLYNHRDLRAHLRGLGHTFASCSDTEVLLKSYAQWGTECVDHFKGMFAFAIAELDSGRLVLARDRLGIKPLYLTQDARRLRFASSLPALLAAGDVDTSIDRTALAHYLSFHAVVPAPRTILTGVRKLPPATVRVVEPDGRSIDTTYWEPEFSRTPEEEGWPEREWQERLLDALRTAVRRRTVADVPVGVLLSGGIDSSAVVALLAESGGTPQTYSIGFEAAGDRPGHEFGFSDVVAERFGTDHQRIMIDDRRLPSAVDAAVAAMSEPMSSHDCVAFYLLAEQVSRSVKVVQSGQGADEVLGGYHWYRPLAGVPRAAAAEAYASVFFDRRDHALRGLLQPAWQHPGDAPMALVTDSFSRPGASTAVDAALRLDTTIMLVDDPVKRVDTMTMAWGLEARLPYLDHDLVEVAARIPPALKLAHGGKGVLKQALRGLLPDPVIERPKASFPVPAVLDLRGPLLSRARDALTDPAARRRGLFRPEVVDAWLTDPNAARTTLGANAVWQLAVLEMWLQAHHVG